MSSGLTQNMMQQGLFWTINGKALKEDKRDKPVLLTLKQGRSYILTIINHTRFPHPMHLHGHTFKVLDADSPYWSDTLFLLPDQTMKVALVADNPGLWMLHCHVLDHLAAGMMGVVEVA